ncbi:hypothetical protein P7C70_g6329, partial [Phenoliferia sp. Uapishka_3]
MAPKRKSDANDGPSAKVAKKESTPVWKWEAKNPTWSSTPPAGPHGKACVEKYCLLAPFDTSITEAQWAAYAMERAEVDAFNTTNNAKGVRLPTLDAQELSCDHHNAFRKLSAASAGLAREIMGSALDATEKKMLSRTLRGSLYTLGLEGQEDEGGPRTVETKGRLYGPHGLGKSIDFTYYFHDRMFAAAYPRDITNCGVGRGVDCWTTERNSNYQDKDRVGTIKVMNCHANKSDNLVAKGTTLANLQKLETIILGRSGVMSQKKIFDTLLATGHVGIWGEDIAADRTAVATKYTLKAGETDGMKEAEEDALKVEDGIPPFDEGAGGYDEKECVPQNLLKLAKSSA